MRAFNQINGLFVMIAVLLLPVLASAEEPVDFKNCYFVIHADQGRIFPYDSNQGDGSVPSWLTLKKVNPRVMWYTDRPEHRSGEISAERFFEEIWPQLFDELSPNAVIDCYVHPEKPGKGLNDGMFVTLEGNPFYAGKSLKLFSKAKLRKWTMNEEPAGPLRLRDIKITVLHNTKEGEGIRWSFAQVAPTAYFTSTSEKDVYELHMEDVYHELYHLSHAPGRDAYVRGISPFINIWRTIFGDNPPNAALTSHSRPQGSDIKFTNKKNRELKTRILTLANPTHELLDNGRLYIKYTAVLQHGEVDVNETLYSPTLLIDANAPSKCGGCTVDASGPGNTPACPTSESVDPADWPRQTGKYGHGTRIIKIQNRCSDDVWMAVFTPDSDSEYQSDGFELKIYGTVLLQVPNDWRSARIWPRTGCDWEHCTDGKCCETGDCNMAKKCTVSGKAPASLVEFTFIPGQNDFYDASLVDGFNLPFQLTPVVNTYDPAAASHTGDPSYWCGCPGSACDLNDCCPTTNTVNLNEPIFKDGLVLADQSNNIVGCYNGCGAMTDKYLLPNNGSDAISYCCPECDPASTTVGTCSIQGDVNDDNTWKLGKCPPNQNCVETNECACGGDDDRWNHYNQFVLGQTTPLPKNNDCLWGCSGYQAFAVLNKFNDPKRYPKGLCVATDTSNWFKRMAPSCYSFAFDDFASTFQCYYSETQELGPDYYLALCPQNTMDCSSCQFELASQNGTGVTLYNPAGQVLGHISKPVDPDTPTTPVAVRLDGSPRYKVVIDEPDNPIDPSAPTSWTCWLKTDTTTQCLSQSYTPDCSHVVMGKRDADSTCTITAGRWNLPETCLSCNGEWDFTLGANARLVISDSQGTNIENTTENKKVSLSHDDSPYTIEAADKNNPQTKFVCKFSINHLTGCIEKIDIPGHSDCPSFVVSSNVCSVVTPGF
jgi:hypothetical protein